MRRMVSHTYTQHLYIPLDWLAPLKGQRLLSGFINPDYFLFDHANLIADTSIEINFPLPVSDLDYLDAATLLNRFMPTSMATLAILSSSY